MQEREKVSSIDIKAHLNNLRKNPKFTEEMLKLVESDLQYGLTIAETETYTSKRLDYAQMKVHSACLRNGYPENVRECIKLSFKPCKQGSQCRRARCQSR